jgi:membrane protein
MRRRSRVLLALGAATLLLRGGKRPLPRSAGPPPPVEPPREPVGASPGIPRRGRVREAADVLRTSVRAALAGNLTDVAASLAYYAFLAIPAALLVAVGVFGVVAGPGTIESLLERLDGVVPDDALSLIDDSLTRVTESSGSAGLALVGLVLALWTSSGAMSALMRGLNRVHGCEETRSFARQRLTALALLGWCLLAIVVSFTLLVLGAPLSRELGEALDAQTLVGRLWWGAQWPILGGALLIAVIGILRAGPASARRDARAELAGAAVAVVIWIVASAGFGFYVSRLGDYGAAWGSLSAVIVMLTWLWLTATALLLGAQVATEVERRRLGSAS